MAKNGMMKRILIIFLLLRINISFSQINKIDFNLTSKGLNIENKKMFKDEFENKKIIGVGEATHGTSEFFKYKAELFKFLVTELDFRNFGIEAQASVCVLVDNYINNIEFDFDDIEGDLNELLDYFNFWAWKTKEVKELIVWMREYNLNHAEKIHFYGFDMQLTYNAVQIMYEYFEKVDSISLVQIKEVYKKYEDPRYSFGYHKLSETIKNSNKKQLEEIHTLIISKKDAFIEKRSLKDWEDAIYLSSVILESEKNFSYPYKKRDQLRDKSMADLVNIYAEIQDDDKAMLWAHNGHICKAKKYNKKTLGMYLQERFKDSYLSIGLLFNSGKFRAQKGYGYNVEVFNLKPAPKESFLYELSSYKSPMFYMNLSLQNESMKAKLDNKQYVYDVPANFKKRKSFTYKPFILAENYDAIVFFNKTHEATPLIRH